MKVVPISLGSVVVGGIAKSADRNRNDSSNGTSIQGLGGGGGGA
jgi:hypothetical protein